MTGIQKNDSLLRNPKPGNIRKVGTSEEPDFEFEFLTGDFEYKNGIYSFTEDSLIRIKANKPGEKYTVHFVDDDGNYIIADPNSVSNSTQTYTYEELKREMNNTASAAWAFRKD